MTSTGPIMFRGRAGFDEHHMFHCAGNKPTGPPPMTPTGPIPFYHDRGKAEAGDAQLKANASNAKSLGLTASSSLVPGSFIGSQRLGSKLQSMRLSTGNEQKAPVKFSPTRGSGFIEDPEPTT